jgi:hypothetical protein
MLQGAGQSRLVDKHAHELLVRGVIRADQLQRNRLLKAVHLYLAPRAV